MLAFIILLTLGFTKAAAAAALLLVMVVDVTSLCAPAQKTNYVENVPQMTNTLAGRSRFPRPA
jgi:hypothetical protein